MNMTIWWIKEKKITYTIPPHCRCLKHSAYFKYRHENKKKNIRENKEWKQTIFNKEKGDTDKMTKKKLQQEKNNLLNNRNFTNTIGKH